MRVGGSAFKLRCDDDLLVLACPRAPAVRLEPDTLEVARLGLSRARAPRVVRIRRAVAQSQRRTEAEVIPWSAIQDAEWSE